MKILMRLGKDPFSAFSANETLSKNPIGNNNGNLLFQLSAYKMLSGKGNNVHGFGYGTSELSAEEINRNYDAFVLPLANAFRPSFLKQLNAYSELIEKLKIPVVVLGVGAQAGLENAGKLDAISEAVRRFCTAVLNRSAAIGVRGEYTAEYLKNLGFNDVEVIGCPSMFLYGDKLPSLKSTHIGKFSNIGINSTKNVPGFYPTMDFNFRYYKNSHYIPQDIDTLRMYLSQSLVDHNYQFDIKHPEEYDHFVFHKRPSPFFLDIITWMKYSRRLDFVFGTRIHGNIIPILAGVPSHVIAHDSRTLELARYFEIPYTVTSDLPDGGCSAESLFLKSDYRDLYGNHKSRFDRLRGFLAKNYLEPDFSASHTDAFFTRMENIELPEPVLPRNLIDSVTSEVRWEAIESKMKRLGNMLSRVERKMEKSRE